MLQSIKTQILLSKLMLTVSAILFCFTLSAQIKELEFSKSDRVRGWSYMTEISSYIVTESNGSLTLYTRTFQEGKFQPVQTKYLNFSSSDNIRGWSWDGKKASYIIVIDNGSGSKKSELWIQPFDGKKFGTVEAKIPISKTDRIHGWSLDGTSASWIAKDGNSFKIYTGFFNNNAFSSVREDGEMKGIDASKGQIIRGLNLRENHDTSFLIYKDGKTFLFYDPEMQKKKPSWKAPKADFCNCGRGLEDGVKDKETRQYSAQLYSSGDTDWESAAKKTVIWINGINQGPPVRIGNKGIGGMWGEWDVVDESCQIDWDFVDQSLEPLLSAEFMPLNSSKELNEYWNFDGCSGGVSSDRDRFLQACIVHDACYAQAWERNGVDKKTACDDLFKQIMDDICEGEGADCLVSAVALRAAVATHWGDLAYWNGQSFRKQPDYKGSSISDFDTKQYGPGANQVATYFVPIKDINQMDNMKLEFFGSPEPEFQDPNYISDHSIFIIRFYKDLNGRPDLNPIYEINIGSATRGSSSAGQLPNGDHISMYSHEFEEIGITLKAGTGYWISIVSNSPNNENYNWSWATSWKGKSYERKEDDMEWGELKETSFAFRLKHK